MEKLGDRSRDFKVQAKGDGEEKKELRERNGELRKQLQEMRERVC